MEYVETNCVIEHEGRKFEFGGAIVTPERIVAYVGPIIGGRGFEGRLGSEPPYRELRDWHGAKLGTIRLTKSWRVRSYVGSRMYQAYATVDGVLYTGRTFGEGMSFTGRKVKR